MVYVWLKLKKPTAVDGNRLYQETVCAEMSYQVDIKGTTRSTVGTSAILRGSNSRTYIHTIKQHCKCVALTHICGIHRLLGYIISFSLRHSCNLTQKFTQYPPILFQKLAQLDISHFLSSYLMRYYTKVVWLCAPLQMHPKKSLDVVKSFIMTK